MGEKEGIYDLAHETICENLAKIKKEEENLSNFLKVRKNLNFSPLGVEENSIQPADQEVLSETSVAIQQWLHMRTRNE